MPASIAAAKAGVTTGEWARRDARGLRRIPRARPACRASPSNRTEGLEPIREAVEAVVDAAGAAAEVPGGQAGPGRPFQRRRTDRRARPRLRHGDHLRGHPPDAGRRSSRGRGAKSAHVVGLSILSGSHLPLIAEVLERMRAAGLAAVPVVVGGIIPDDDAAWLAPWRGAGLYAQGFRAEPDHDGHRRAGQPRRLNRLDRLFDQRQTVASSRRKGCAASCPILPLPLRPGAAAWALRGVALGDVGKVSLVGLAAIAALYAAEYLLGRR